MELSAAHVFNCIVLMAKFGLTSCEDIPPALFLLHGGLKLISCVCSYDQHFLSSVMYNCICLNYTTANRPVYSVGHCCF